MTEITLAGFGELLNLLSNPSVHYYRGVADAKYGLVPKIGRDPYRGLEDLDHHLLRMFRERAVPFLTSMPRDKWEWIALAQHHGLPTRLLDWSSNPLVAAYFAVEKDRPRDCALYCLPVLSTHNIDTEKYPDPFKVDSNFVLHPTHISTRISAQSGVFTVHPKPQSPFTDDSMVKITIPANIRSDVKRQLLGFGMNPASLFPGLDGTAQHLAYWFSLLSGIPMTGPKT